MATHSIISSGTGSVLSPATLHHCRSLHFPLSISLPSNLQTTKFSLRQNPNSNLIPKSPPSMAASAVQAFSSAAAGEVSGEVGTTSSGLVGQNDLLIIGPGVLGRLVAQQWREEHPGCQVYGQTATMDHHDELIQMGINPVVKGTKLPNQFPYVIFCAPPSKSPDYTADVKEAASSWSGEGSLAFTSSSVLFDCADNGCCDEDTPVVPMGRSPRTDVMLKAEKVALDYGGCVLRLAGLYKADRGAHTYWLRQVKSELLPDHIVNLINYEDASSLVIAILKKNLRGRVFLGCDDQPLSRREIMDLVNESGKFDGKFEGFTGTSGPLGKRLNNSKTREEIGWEPKYRSFAQFLEEL